MLNLIELLNKLPKSLLFVAGLLLVGLIGLLDHLDGGNYSTLIWYLPPIFLVSWVIGRWPGILTAALGLVVWSVVNRIGMPPDPPANSFLSLIPTAILFLGIPYLLSEMKNALERERELARIDPLTQVANRRSFIEQATVEISRARRYAQPLTFAYLDLDDFKALNDRFGHSAGDSILRLVTTTIQKNIRSIDIVARWGGDEFIILLPDTRMDAGASVLRRIQKSLSEALQTNSWMTTVSIGAVTFISPPHTPNEMIRIADNLMYAAKDSGKNCIRHEVVDESGMLGHPGEGPPAGE